MALMMRAPYDALRSANVEDEKSREAAEEVADYDKRVDGLEASIVRLGAKLGQVEQKFDGRFTLLQWMLGFDLAISTMLLLKAFA